jgi:16S rRNA G966 N2-methylase RsmD
MTYLIITAGEEGEHRMTACLYTYAAHVDERALFMMECRALFGQEPGATASAFWSAQDIDPSRSPFIKGRIRRLQDGACLTELADRIDGYRPAGPTFKIVYVKTGEDVPFAERRAAERLIGQHIRGQAEMRQPETVLGIAFFGGRWIFGPYVENTAVWLKHNEKPQHYSTALSTRVARAVANIAVPVPEGIRVIDPCCGIGTVLIEALSMGMAVTGYDLNWMAVHGARANLAHFGYPNVVKVEDMRTLEGRYDAAILDMPYNLCSKLSTEDQQQLLNRLHRLAPRAVIVTVEPIDKLIDHAGYQIADRCIVKKGRFEREVLLCIDHKQERQGD